MRAEKFDFRRLFDEWDDSLEGKRCIMSDSLDEIFDAVEENLDQGEIVEHGKETNNFPFYSNKEGACFYYAYVLDEDFVEEPEKPLAEVRWFREDVEVALDKKLDEGEIMSVSDSDVDAVIDRISWRAVEDAMIERGWDFIDMAVDEYVDERKGTCVGRSFGVYGVQE